MTDEEITELLFVREDPIRADLTMVFAAACEEGMDQRIRRGVQLYREGYVPRLLVTGGGVLARFCPEAKRMAELAREHGVADADLLVEDRSSNTFENVKFSLSLLDTCGLLGQLRTIILVSSEWHMRRVLLTTKAYFLSDLRFVCCPTLEGCNRDNWFSTDACREEVMREVLLLEAFRETGAI